MHKQRAKEQQKADKDMQDMFYKDSELRKRNKNFDLDNMEKKYIEREMFK